MLTASPRHNTWSASLMFTGLAIILASVIATGASYQLARAAADKNVELALQAISQLRFHPNNTDKALKLDLSSTLEAYDISTASVRFSNREPIHYISEKPRRWLVVDANAETSGNLVVAASNALALPQSVTSISVTSSVAIHPPLLLLFILAGFAVFIVYTIRAQSQSSKVAGPIRDFNAMTDLPSGFSSHKLSPPETATKASPLIDNAELVQSELALAQQSAIEANRFKSKLIANASHEILTPLNSVLGFASLLKKKLDTPGGSLLSTDEQDTLGKLELIISNAEHINGLVNDLVVLSHEEHRGLRLNYCEVKIADMLNDVAASFEYETRNKGLQLKILMSDIDDLMLWTDPLRLRQILYNLLANAVRYTQHGSITVSATVDRSTTPFSLIVKISDTGPGIDEDRLPVLFSAFVRGDEPVKTEQAGLGLGLGLSIVRSLTQLLNATIGVESTVGKGSAFTLTLPFRGPPLEAPESSALSECPTVENTSETLDLLVVDDMPANALLVEEQLKNYNCRITVAHSGNDAIELTRSQQFDTILLDIRMQPLSGQQILAEIKRNPRYTTTPVIAFTAHKSEYDRQELLKLGFADVIHKPVYQKTLVNTFNLKAIEQPSGIEDEQINASAPPKTEGSIKSCHELFDANQALKKCAGNVETAKRIISLVVEDMREKSNAYKRGELGSGEALIDNIHHLNGTAALSGTPRLKETINNFESLLLRPDNHSQDAEIDTSLRALFLQVDDFLEWAENADFNQLFENQDD